jgi:hypothetical protein
VSYRVLGHKFQQCRITKVVSTFEGDMPTCEIRVLLEVRSQTFCIAGVEQLDRTAKCGVFNSFVMWKVELITRFGLLNATLQFHPARKSTLTRNRELRIAQSQMRDEYFVIRSVGPARVKLADSLGYGRVMRGVPRQDILRLVLEVLQARLFGKGSYGHNELPFVRPRSA